MLAGPVFEFELKTTARRGRYYFLRAAYALVLLWLLYQSYLAWELAFGRVLTHQMVALFARSTFTALAVCQEVLVLVLTPALVAGVIASEKQSKTLHYVMASPLTSVEIVLGKLGARMLHVAIFLAVGFPILSMLVLLGGVDPRLVLLGCASAVSSAFLLAGMAVLVSVYARRVGEALFLAYALELLWLTLPEVLEYAVPSGWPIVGDAFETVNAWVLASNPIEVGRSFLPAWVMRAGGAIDELLWMIGIQAAAGVLFTLWAALRLRPVYRKQQDTDGRPIVFRPTSRRGRRRGCGNRPMIWKEQLNARSSRLVRVLGGLVALTVGAPLVYWTLMLFPPAFDEARTTGWLVPRTWGASIQRHNFEGFVQIGVAWLFLLGIVSVAGSAAGMVTAEHEEDTWVSLTSTDLTGPEIVLAKVRSALRGARLVKLALVVLVSLGVVAGSVHPLGALAFALSVIVYGWFAAALGVWVSFQLKSTWRAQFLTISFLLLINLLGQGILNTLRRFPPFVLPGFMPVELSRTMFSPASLDYLRTEVGRQRFWPSVESVDHGPFWATVFGTLSVTSYAALALVLTWASLRRFERVAGRAVRSKRCDPRSARCAAPIKPSRNRPVSATPDA